MHFKCFALQCLSITYLLANPLGERIVSGDVQLERSQGELLISQTTQKAIVEWEQFSIEMLETTEFRQPSSTASILNRVVGTLPSRLEGTLKSNGAVYLINPQGIVIDGKVTTERFVASTFDLGNAEFLSSSQPLFLDSFSKGEILHRGEVDASLIMLLANRIRQEGVFRAKEGVVKLHVSPNFEKTYFLDSKIELAPTALIDVSGPRGGTVELLSHDQIDVREGACLVADGREGSGGSMLLWAHDSIHCKGHLSAEALGNMGDGGFIEISANQEVVTPDTIHLRSRFGKAGTFLIDPGTVTINNSSTTGTGGVFGDAYIESLLASGSVSITTATDGTDSGNETLTFDNASGAVTITWSTANTLTLTGRRNVVVESGTVITSTNSGANFDALILQGNTTSATGNFSGITSAGLVISTVSGNISFTGTGGTSGANQGINLDGTSTFTSTGSGSFTLVGTGGSSSICPGIRILTTPSITCSGSGSISLTGTGGSGGNSAGISLSDTTLSTTTGGLTLVGTGGSGGTFGNHGISIDGVCTLSTSSGPLTGTGTSGPATDSTSGIKLQGNISTVNGTISFTGTGGSGSRNSGITITPSISITATGSGTMTFSGTATGADGENYGVVMAEVPSGTYTISTVSGAISVTGIGSGTSGSGILSQSVVPLTLSSTSGAISFSGTAAGSGTGITLTANDTIGAVSGTGQVTLTSDSMSISSATLRGIGTLQLQPLTPSIAMGLGAASAGTLTFTSAQILSFASNGFTNVIFGRSNGTGLTTMTAQTYSSATTVQNGSITVSGALAAGANNMTLNIGGGNSGTLTLNARISTTGTTSFSGGNLNDTFAINVTEQTATINGGLGSNTLIGPDATNTWRITRDNGGTLNSTLSFSNIGNLTGGSLGDQFIFSSGADLTGQVRGGGSLSLNILDYTLYSPPPTIVFLTASSGTASNLGDGFQEIGSVLGSVLNVNEQELIDLMITSLTTPFYYCFFPQISGLNYNLYISCLNGVVDPTQTIDDDPF